MRSLVVIFASACYQPAAVTPCAATCDFASASPCPEGFVCVEGGRCAEPGTTCSPTIDATPDGPPCPGPVLGTDALRICLKAQPAQSAQLPSAMLDTDSDALCDNTQQRDPLQGMCVVVGTDIHMSGPLHAMGNNGLVLAAHGTITIDFMLDATSFQNIPAAGGNWSGCTTMGTDANNTDGGGAGGSYQGVGGDGAAVIQIHRGKAAPAIPFGVHGGCVGGNSTANGSGGAGGGMLYLIASGTINISAGLVAAGAGGEGGPQGIGGGGGGSGGLIELDAMTISVGDGAVLVASGGGGGGGGGDAMAGNDGLEPGAPSWIGTAGPGGGSAMRGTDGGSGNLPNGTSGVPAVTGDATDASGGGGGGGGGYVRIKSSATPDIKPTATIAPPATIVH